MKTLDEMIKALEYCITGKSCAHGECPYSEENCVDHGIEKDALHYLKEYRDAKDALDTERERTIKAYCQWEDAKEKLEAQTSHMMWVDKHFQFEISDNPPLTWDELKTMEGKPVWVVVDGKERWHIIREVSHEHLILESGLPLHRCWMNHPNGWQAYRKER